MTRGLLGSLGLHVGIFAAVWLGPRPHPFEWDPERSLAVELVASAVELPPAKPPQRRPPPTPPPQDPPVKEPVTEPREEEAPPETPPDVAPVTTPRKAERPPRKFQRVAPLKTDEGPSLEERLRRRLDEVEEPEEGARPPTPSEETGLDPPADPAATHSAEVEALDFPFAWYLRQVQTRVRDAWDTPGDRLLTGHPPVGLTLVIHRDGHVSDVRIAVPSGTPGLDASALRAVQRAQPFPPLPEPYEGDRLTLTIRFRVSGARS